MLVLERAPEDESGGNSRFTAGLMRIAYNGVDDLRPLIDLSEEEIARTDFGTYTEEQFLDDMARVTEYRCDPDLTEILVKQSLPTVEWMRKKGVRFTAAWGRQAFNIGGKFKFWGGLTVEAVGGGPGLVESLTAIAKKNGIEIWYEARAPRLAGRRRRRQRGQWSRQKDKTVERQSARRSCSPPAASRRTRVAHALPRPGLGARQGARHALQHRRRHPHGARHGAAAPPATGRAATRWPGSATRPEFGDLAVGDQFQKHSYPWGIYINAEGKRFVDEGADFRNYTYAKYGRVILRSPGSSPGRSSTPR